MSATITLDQADYNALCARHQRLRQKLIDIARECASCGGTGRVTVSDFGGAIQVSEPCGDCLDIRECLA